MLWCVVAALLLFVFLWPLLGGMVVINDDLKFVRSPACDLSIGDHLQQMWASHTFRPLEVLVGRTCDPVTLRCSWVLPIQACGFALICWAVAELARILLPSERRLAPLAIILLSLSPATTAALWQMDTCSQTWGVALGLWSCVIAWRGFECAKSGRWPWLSGALLASCFIVSAFIKETAYGWSLGIGLCIIGGAVMLLRHNRAASLRVLPILLGAVVVPMALLAVRLSAGALEHGQGEALDNPYKLEFGINLPVNAMMATIGAASTGPFHLIMNGGAPLVLRALPGVACILAGLIAVTAFEFGFLRGRDEERRACRLAVMLLLATAGSAAITCLMQTVSELYGFGFNAGFSLLIALAVLLVARASDDGKCARAVGAATTAAIVTLLAIGAFGLSGRAAHFQTTWTNASRTNAAIIQAADAWVAEVAESKSDPRAQRGTRANADTLEICFGPACRPGTTYGQYICSVMQSIDWDTTVQWMLRRNPDLRLSVRADLDCSLFAETVFTVECPVDPAYGNW